jgi:hypoxanthine phosphoribosyltransferase
MPLLSLFSSGQIAKRVGELGSTIAQTIPSGPILVVGVLRGAFIFMADLVRAIPREVTCDFLRVRSYGAGSVSSGKVELLQDLSTSIRERHVLLVEDIIDTGLTIQRLRELLEPRKPQSLWVCSLLDKPSRRIVPVQIDFIGFEIPDHYVVGYGLDHNEQFRNLPFLGALDPIP